MKKEAIQTSQAPAPIGPYSQAIRCGSLLFVSGQVALIPGTDNELDNASIEQETHRVLKNLDAILTAAGLGFGSIVKTTIFLSDMALFGKVNEIYAGYFEAGAVYPARETVAVKGLPKNVQVEISVIAAYQD